ncbi:hypothetical protein GCM10009677_63260 [Sphaerisporangium rubeum]|uniref:Monooxygenase n=1 Tax=Sphaerisporangium rubeum TaxID=321317 RepID=A0A7X0M655_9ACTN|nr:hypothetical protein [Sphaerisporangium rubeum]
MLIFIEGSELPGRECEQAPGFPGYSNIHVGVQRRGGTGEMLGLTAADASSVLWELEVTAIRTESGWDLRGPFVQGRPGGRFVYLSWGTVDEAGVFSMFRRAKLWLEAIPADVLERAVAGGVLVARLGLTDAKRQPLCASVRPPLVEWTTPAN